MTPHMHELADAALACLVLAAFLLGRYHWPHVPGLNARLDDAYQEGRDDQSRHDAQIIGRLEMELDWWERGGGAHDALHPAYEVLSPAALDAVNDLPAPEGPSTVSREGQSGAVPDRGGELHLLDWDAIRGHMTPLDLDRLYGMRMLNDQAVRLAEWRQACRAAWDLAKVAA